MFMGCLEVLLVYFRGADSLFRGVNRLFLTLESSIPTVFQSGTALRSSIASPPPGPPPVEMRFDGVTLHVVMYIGCLLSVYGVFRRCLEMCLEAF